MANTLQGALTPNIPIEELLQGVVNEARMRNVSIRDGLVHQCAQHIFYDVQNWGGDPEDVPEYVQRNVLAAAGMIEDIKLFPPDSVETIVSLIYRKLSQQLSGFTTWDAHGNWSGWRYTEDENLAWRDGRGRVEFRAVAPSSRFFEE